MGANEPGVGSLRAWPILPHRSPGRPVKEKEEIKKPKVIEVEERPKVVEVKTERAIEELKLEEEEEGEGMKGMTEVMEVAEKPAPVEKQDIEGEKEATKESVIEVKEEAEMIEEGMPPEEPEPAPKGPPIPSSLPYRGSLCPAGRSATLGRSLFEKERKTNGGWWVSGRVGTEIPRGGSAHPRRRAGKSGAPA
jgi:hypothetical protein